MPVILKYGEPPVKFKFNVPVFSIVNVFVCNPAAVITLPKSVSSVNEGVVSPSAMLFPLPIILISGAGVFEIIFTV